MCGRKLNEGASTSFTYPRKKRCHGEQCCCCVTVTFSSPSTSPVVQVDTLPNILHQWRCPTFSRFVLIMVKGHHPQLMCHPPFFHNFTWFHIKDALAYHPIILKEVDGLPSKGSIEPWMGSGGFY